MMLTAVILGSFSILSFFDNYFNLSILLKNRSNQFQDFLDSPTSPNSSNSKRPRPISTFNLQAKRRFQKNDQIYNQFFNSSSSSNHSSKRHTLLLLPSVIVHDVSGTLKP